MNASKREEIRIEMIISDAKNRMIFLHYLLPRKRFGPNCNKLCSVQKSQAVLRQMLGDDSVEPSTDKTSDI